jgi:hypothetical protein
MTNIEITDAIITHGAKAVYDACRRHMGGDIKRGLGTVGLLPVTMGDVWRAMSAAYDQMAPDEQAIDNASATSLLATRFPTK